MVALRTPSRSPIHPLTAYSRLSAVGIQNIEAQPDVDALVKDGVDPAVHFIENPPPSDWTKVARCLMVGFETAPEAGAPFFKRTKKRERRI